MDLDHTSRSVRIPAFDGEAENFTAWWIRFQAYAGTLGFENAIQVTVDANFPAKSDDAFDETTAEGTKKSKAKKQNAYAFHTFALAFTTEDLLSKLESAKTTDWPGGLAHLVTAELMEEFRPKDTISRVEMRMAMARITMGKRRTPRN